MRINEEIRVPEVRLIDAEGKSKGILSIEKAMAEADAAGLDLVEISATTVPPVCRITNFDKYRFHQIMKRKLAKKRQRTIHVKEMKLRPATETGDYQRKLRDLIRFLGNGDPVKVTLCFRGREMAHRELGRGLLERVAADIEIYGKIDHFPRMEGRQMVMQLVRHTHSLDSK